MFRGIWHYFWSAHALTTSCCGSLGLDVETQESESESESNRASPTVHDLNRTMFVVIAQVTAFKAYAQTGSTPTPPQTLGRAWKVCSGPWPYTLDVGGW